MPRTRIPPMIQVNPHSKLFTQLQVKRVVEGEEDGSGKEMTDGVIEVEEEEDIDTLEVGNSTGITEISTSMTRTYESRAQRRFHQVCVHP